MRKFFQILMILAGIGSLLSFYTTKENKDNTLTKKEKKEGWKLLFDGKTTNGWKSYQGKEQDGWAIANGELFCKETGVKKRADLITVEMFDNFELTIDWKISPKHNSGIIYRCTEENGASYESGPEYQLIDDLGYPDKLNDKQLSGANYDMDAPIAKVMKLANEYNHTKIIVNNAHVEHWLNGTKVVEYEFWTPEWEKTKAGSKWKDLKTYGMSKTGHIAIQDHGGGVTLKNIKIRKL